MAQPLEWFTFASHVSVLVACAFSLWAFQQRREYYRTVVRLRSLPLIFAGFIGFILATVTDMIEHVQAGSWLYDPYFSIFNQLFFAFAVAGVGLIALGLKKSKLSEFFVPASLAALLILLAFQGSRSILVVLQLIPTIFFVSHWYIQMRDWRVFLYPILVSMGIVGLIIWLDNGGHPGLYASTWLLRAIALGSLGYVAWVNPKRLKH